MIIGTSEDGIVRQCEQCNTVYKGSHCPHCALAAMNRHKRPKRTKRKKTYAQISKPGASSKKQPQA